MKITVQCEIEIDDEIAGTTDVTILCHKAQEFIRDAVADSSLCQDFIWGPYQMKPVVSDPTSEAETA